MRRLGQLHLALLVLAWLLSLTWGPAGVLVVTGVLTCVELLLWRLDLTRPETYLRRLRLPRRQESDSLVPTYDALRHAITMGAHSRREFDFGLRRVLERVASTRLADGHGLDLHRQPDAARRLLGEEVFELLDPRRPVSGDRTGGGVPTDRLARIVERLETL